MKQSFSEDDYIRSSFLLRSKIFPLHGMFFFLGLELILECELGENFNKEPLSSVLNALSDFRYLLDADIAPFSQVLVEFYHAL